MQPPKSFTAALLTFVMVSLTGTTLAQRRTSRPGPTPAAPVVQPLTFDNLLSIDSYKVYVEVRNVGQLVSSSSFNEMLEPVFKLAAPPQEFKTAIKWLATHAEAVTSSRIMVATWPTAKGLPDVLVAVEFDTEEEASKFEPRLREILPKVLPAAKPSPSRSPSPQVTPGDASATSQPASTEAIPNFHLSRSGSLVFVASAPLTVKNLRPRNSKALNEDQAFRIAYGRFTSESLFAFVNIKALEIEERERREKADAEAKKTVSEIAVGIPPEDLPDVASPTDPAQQIPTPEVLEAVVEPKPSPTPPDPVAIAMTQVMAAFFGTFIETKWPEAIGIAGNLDAGSLDLKALLVSSQGEKIAAIPFFPALVTGPAIVPESPSILPADTELFVTMSLDLPQVYSVISQAVSHFVTPTVAGEPTADAEQQSPFAFIENKAGIKLQADLLPLLGNEVVFSMPVGPNSAPPTSSPSAGTPGEVENQARRQPGLSPTIALSLRDKEGMRRLLPKLIDALGFKGASAFAQVERREDTEVVTYANVLSYALIGNFLLISQEVTNINHVVDSYLKRETLSSDISFRNSMRWQPRHVQGQVYISPVLMESYKRWANEPNSLISDQTRSFLISLAVTSEPVTYSLSNEGTGPLHQLRIPKNLLLMAVAGVSGESNEPPEIANERAVLGTLYYLVHLESSAMSEKGSYLSLDELVAQHKITREQLVAKGYHIEVTLVGNGFEVVAVPVEYGKTGKMSYFVNESGVIRAGDHGGGRATLADRPVQD